MIILIHFSSMPRSMLSLGLLFSIMGIMYVMRVSMVDFIQV